MNIAVQTTTVEHVFDLDRLRGEIDGLAEKHAGRDDAFRNALAQLLKAELAKGRQLLQAELLKDRHGRR